MIVGGTPSMVRQWHSGTWLVALAALVAAPRAAAGQPVNGDCEVALTSVDFVSAGADLGRVLDLLGAESRHSFAVRRASDRTSANACNVPAALRRLSRSFATPQPPERGAAVLPAYLRVAANSDYPRDWNNGAQWAGTGASASLNGGATFRWYWFEAAFAPLLTVQENLAYDLTRYPDSTTYSAYIDRWHGRFIDLPQRFGIGAFSTLDAGQSYARVRVAGWRAGVSNENLSWGPARRNPLLLSGTAPGFPHVFIETSRPNNVVLGTAELQLFWGRLSESDFFDREAANNHRALSGVVIAFRPHGLDGLYLGGSRLHMQTWSTSTSVADVLFQPFTGLERDSAGLPRDLRLYALFLRWVAAPAGFELYGEWARQDEWKHWLRLLNRVNSSQGYTIGLQKVIRRGDNAVRVAAEITQLADALPSRDVGRGLTSFYLSPHVTQGHTHRGQLLGAAIGPGSEAQFIGADLFWRWGRSSLSVERVRYHDDAYHAVWSQFAGPHGYDTEVSVRGGHLFTLPYFSIEAELGFSTRYNRDFLGLGRANLPERVDENFALQLSGRWNPPPWVWEPR